jgi:hypothetical protein
LARLVLALLLVFLALAVLRALRVLMAGWMRGGRPAGRPLPTEGQMARDPVCGVWFDRRLAVAGRLGDERIEVCSDACRRRLEAR